MSNPKYFWNSYVQKCIRYYPNKLDVDTFQGKITKDAIANALDRLNDDEKSREKVSLIDMVYLSKTHTINGASMVLGVSERTAQRWLQEFVYEVAKNMGFR